MCSKERKNSLTIYSGLKDTLIRLTTNDRNWIYTTRNMTFSWFIELGAVFLFSLTYLGIEKKWMKLLSSMSVFVCEWVWINWNRKIHTKIQKLSQDWPYSASEKKKHENLRCGVYVFFTNIKCNGRSEKKRRNCNNHKSHMSWIFLCVFRVCALSFLLFLSLRCVPLLLF